MRSTCPAPKLDENSERPLVRVLLYRWPMATPLWTIVLAAGAGRRLVSVTGGVPKQYWRPEGAQSLLESTVERPGPLARPERTLTIVDETHRDHVRRLDPRGTLGEIIFQPMDRGTAAGVLLPLAAVVASSPDAS